MRLGTDDYACHSGGLQARDSKFASVVACTPRESLLFRDRSTVTWSAPSTRAGTSPIELTSRGAASMHYWITTHWPRRVGDPRPLGNGVYLSHEKGEVGRDLRAGDLVLVYQSQSGRTRVVRELEGTTHNVPCEKGKGGIVAIGRALSTMQQDDDAEIEQYTDGTAIHWKWKAPLEVLSTSGFVSRQELNRILGYKPKYIFHGFGDQSSGLKKIDEATYLEIETAFRDTQPPDTPLFSIEPPKGGPPGGEQAPHRRLKQYVAWAPTEALREAGLVLTKMEHVFPTCDRADVVFSDHVGRKIAVEVEVDVGAQDRDIIGVLQALKYAAMLEPLYGRNPGDSRAILVAYSVSDRIRALCKRYDVACVTIDRAEVDAWHLAHPQRATVPPPTPAPAATEIASGSEALV